MQTRLKRLITSKSLFLAAGTLAVLLVVLLVWAEFTAPFNFRQPIPSPDGNFFAYFDLIGRSLPSLRNDYDLIIATTQGGVLARFRMEPGAISWSNAGYLAVINHKENRAHLIPNNDGRFLVLKDLAFAPGTEPLWSEDGTKLAYIPPSSEGEGIAIYDFQQTQNSLVSLPRDFRLRDPSLLFWSPGSTELFFLNSRDQSEDLIRLDIASGNLHELAEGSPNWKVSSLGLPRMSPDGNKIHLPLPLNSVIDAETGKTLWTLPRGAKALWSMWSSDGRRLYFVHADGPSRIYIHDFTEAVDHVMLTHAEPYGFVSRDGRNFLFRTPPRLRFMDVTSLWGEWIQSQWGWQLVDLTTGTSHPLGRAELSPWEQTQGGAVLMARDDLIRTHYGLYEPTTGSFSEFTFPSDGEDVLRQAKAEFIILFSVLLYGSLGFLVYLSRPNSPPARALCVLSFLLMILFTSLSAVDATFPLANSPFPSSTKLLDLIALGWSPLARRLWMIEGEGLLAVIAIALVPPALLHFSLVFPEQNKFLARKKVLKSILYVAAFAPLIGVVQLVSGHRASTSIQPILIGFYLLAGPVSIITALFALLHSYRHPPDRRAKDQIRWVSLAFVGPPVGLVALLLLVHLVNGVGHWLGSKWQNIPEAYFFVTGLALFCLFPPLAIGYALIAHKLFDIRLLIRRSVRYSLITFVVVLVYLTVVGGLSWVIAGSLESPSQPVVIVATLFTALVVAPARNRLQAFIDRTFDRAHYDVRESLQKFSHSLPTILDRQTLESRIRESVTEAMKCQGFYLFILDRRSMKLRLQVPKEGVSPEAANIEFDPSEPLCKHLLGRGHAFEVEISPHNPKLTPIVQSVGDRLSRLGAALVLGLVRRGEIVGMMVLGAKASEEFYNAEDLQLLQGVAHQAATAVENTELFEEVARDREMRKELEVASEVQAQLFPITMPNTLGCQIAGRCLPASSVSGDYYDFLELPGQRIGVAIGDVSGKGMSAALLMANLQGLLRTQALVAESPAELVRRINRQLFNAAHGAKYCTFFYGVYNERDRRLIYSNAGHNAPLLLSSAGIRFLDATGVPLGLFPEVAHEVHCEELEPGALILLYSDGITEARNSKGEDYGVDRLLSCLKRVPNSNATDIMEKILDDVRTFLCGAPVEDDQTIVLLQVKKDSFHAVQP